MLISKKFILTEIFLFVVTLFCAETFGQSIQVGAKMSYNSSWLFNSNISDAGPLSADHNYISSFGYSRGASVGYYLHKNTYYNYLIYGLDLGVMVTDHTQRYVSQEKVDGVTEEVEYMAQLSFIDLPLLFRITPEHGPYLEVGPQYSILTYATGLSGNFTNNKDYSDKNTISNYQKSNISAVLGFGVDIGLWEHLAISAGCRIVYGLTDITAPQESEIIGYSPTHAISGGLMFGAVYKINHYH